MPVAWAVRHNSPELRAALNDYLKHQFWVDQNGQHRSRFYGILYERYYQDPKQIRGFQEAAARPDLSGRISPYDDLFQTVSQKEGLDWRLVAALAFRESRFKPDAVSRAGARGLMQILPRFAGVEAGHLDDPEINVNLGVRLLREIYDGYAYLDSLNRWRFTLATYHAGVGHMADARRLAIDRGRDPNQWEGSVEASLPHLREQKFYSEARHGLFHGEQTVAYVQDILNRYRLYRQLVPDPDSAAGFTLSPLTD
jgi:membrane-bound lytic murein transglycosylase F